MDLWWWCGSGGSSSGSGNGSSSSAGLLCILSLLFMSPLRLHIFDIFVCFMAKGGFFGPSSVKRGRTHIVLG